MTIFALTAKLPAMTGVGITRHSITFGSNGALDTHGLNTRIGHQVTVTDHRCVAEDAFAVEQLTRSRLLISMNCLVSFLNTSDTDDISLLFKTMLPDKKKTCPQPVTLLQ